MTPTRENFLVAVRALENTPYLWGGKMPPGLDCSGLVTWALKVIGGPDMRQSWNSDVLFDLLPATAEPIGGDLAFYGPHGDPNHVVVCLGGRDDQIIGANGGGRDTLSLERARRQQACVKTKATPAYRPDLLGFRSTNPWWQRETVT